MTLKLKDSSKMLIENLQDLTPSQQGKEYVANANTDILQAALQSKSIIADSAALANATTDVDVLTMDVAAATSEAGSVFQVDMAGVQSNSTSDCNLQAYIKIGTTKLVTCAVAVGTTVKTDRGWRFRGSVTIRSATTALAEGSLAIAGLAADAQDPTSVTTIPNISAAFQIKVGFTWATAVSGTSAKALTAIIRRAR